MNWIEDIARYDKTAEVTLDIVIHNEDNPENIFKLLKMQTDSAIQPIRNISAEYLLGYMLYEGVGTRQNISEGVKYIMEAGLDAYFPPALYFLGDRIWTEKIRPETYVKEEMDIPSRDWYMQEMKRQYEAEQIQSQLKGLHETIKNAYFVLSKAAEQGFAPAELRLKIMRLYIDFSAIE